MTPHDAKGGGLAWPPSTPSATTGVTAMVPGFFKRSRTFAVKWRFGVRPVEASNNLK